MGSIKAHYLPHPFLAFLLAASVIEEAKTFTCDSESG